ncbi:HNH endonuclease [Shouchella clausii]|uniref:HNH endonuclease n=1 Tax=Shouchella clausii TaxID=79880 RepID=UPI00226D1E3E|nr:HNH endonuclease [Shouchella clausii]MCY1103769.1 HNH endonuclease [Shouchella clausii]
MAKAKDLTGKTFGKLEVLHRSPKRSKSGRAVWVCRCECEAITEVESHHLLSGSTISCGCARSDAGKAMQQYNKEHLIKDGVYTHLLTSKVRSDSKTGVKGVTITKNGKYQARIAVKNQHIHLGLFNTLEEAAAARKEAEEKYHKPLLEDNNE